MASRITADRGYILYIYVYAYWPVWTTINWLRLASKSRCGWERIVPLPYIVRSEMLSESWPSGRKVGFAQNRHASRKKLASFRCAKLHIMHFILLLAGRHIHIHNFAGWVNREETERGGKCVRKTAEQSYRVYVYTQWIGARTEIAKVSIELWV